jgi:AsmA protein
MGKLLKILLSVFAGLVLLILAAVIVLPFAVDPNDFKPQIQAAVQEHTGRQLDIEGDLSLSVFPWVGVSTGKLTLSNAPGFGDKPFAIIEESDIKVKLVPLFSKQVEVSRIVLQGLALNLGKNKQGVSNWDDLVTKSAEDQPQATKPTQDPGDSEPAVALAAFAIGGISIENANIVWDDQQSKQHVEVKEFNLVTDKLAFDESIPVQLSLSVITKEPELTEHIKFNAKVVINQKFDVINLNDLRLESHSVGKPVPGGELKASLKSDVAVDLTRQTLLVSGLKLSSGELQVSADIKGQQIIDKPSFSGAVSIAEFNLKKLLRQMAISLPEMSDSNAMSKLSARFNLQATADSAALNDLSVMLDDSSVAGSLKIRSFAAPAIAFNLNLDAIDADRYMAPVFEDKPARSAAASPAAVAVASASLLPVDTLRGLNANGVLTVGKLKINNLKMQDISLKLDAAKGVLKTQQTIKQLYQGSYSGGATINVTGKQPAIALNEKLSGVQVEPLIKDLQAGDVKMSGAVNANANLQTYGNSTQAIKSALNGNVDFQFKDSVIRGFNLQKMLDNTKALIEGAPLPTENKNDQTVFSEISGSAVINNGLVSNEDLKALSSKLIVEGAGTANLATDKLDYKVNAKVIKKATDDRPEQVKGLPLMIIVGGTFAKPRYTLDVPAMLLEKNKEKIEQKKEELLKKLDEKVGPGVGEIIDKNLGPKATDLLKKFF